MEGRKKATGMTRPGNTTRDMHIKIKTPLKNNRAL